MQVAAVTQPSLTVVMPVYNALPYLNAAIESILCQTYRTFRLAIYDDHSTDGSYDCALEWAARDDRIDVARGNRRMGPSGSSNAAAALARTDLVARMDADDIMAPDRLEAQMAAMAANPDAVLVGSTFSRIDAVGRPLPAVSAAGVGGDGPPIAHCSILYRRDAFDAAGGYRRDAEFFEDRDLYLRMAEHGSIIIINRPLLQVRFAGQHARLHDDPESVLKKINRLYVDGSAGSDAKRPYSPMAFYSIVHLSMLGGRRPHILGLLLRRMNLDRPPLAMGVAGITALAELSPWAARKLWQARNRTRSWAQKSAERGEDIYIWQPVRDAR